MALAACMVIGLVSVGAVGAATTVSGSVSGAVTVEAANVKLTQPTTDGCSARPGRP